jgi:U4/U6.U5 tri-snRNP-associated protein 2
VFTAQSIQALNSNSLLARDVYGVSYLPGFVGLNNLKVRNIVTIAMYDDAY